MNAISIKVTRSQLEKFLPDPDTIRQFEKLIALLNTLPSETLDSLTELSEAIEALQNNEVKLIQTLDNLADVRTAVPRDLSLLQYNQLMRRWEDNALVWVDIDFPIIIRTTGANIPTLATLNGNLTMPQWAVNDFNVCESQEYVHGWKEGSEVFWHVHLTTNSVDGTDRYVKFELEYGYVDVTGVWVFPAVLTTADLTIPANTPAKTMMIMVLGSFTPPVKIGGHSVARLKRVAAAGTAPSANPWIPMLQQHVQLDTMGSRGIGTK